MRLKDLSGRVFGRLVVIKPAAHGIRRRFLTRDCHRGHRQGWSLCWCSCGGMTVVQNSHLVRSNSTGTRSCGCLNAEAQTHHGMSNTPTYYSWVSMRVRCGVIGNDPKTSYREVKVCSRWSSFENFLFDMGTRPEGKTIGRFGDVGNYEPGNCAWMTPKEQGAEHHKKCEAKKLAKAA